MTHESLHTKSKQYEVKLIDANDTYLVRHPILRPEKPFETCVFHGDNLKTTIHIGLFIEKKIIGVCTFMKNNNTLFSNINQYQLRGMAILTPFQKKGYGNAILNFAEAILKKDNPVIIWCNARKFAIPFYEKNNYKKIGKPFNVAGIGVHYVMSKTL